MTNDGWGEDGRRKVAARAAGNAAGRGARLAAPALAQAAGTASDPIRLLIEQSQYWQSRGDGARAKENWERLLRISPNQPEALEGLAQAALDEDKPELARDYLRQLQAAHPNSPLIARLEQSIRVGGNRQQLQAARNLAQQGRSQEAAAEYRQALGGQVPTGDLALEYYQALGGSAQGWDEARQGLEKLASADPGNAAKALALAQHLTYRETTRADGLRRLAELARRPEVAQEAGQAWRRALPWLGSGSAAQAGYQAYLQQFPDDAQARAQLDSLHREQQARADEAQQSRDPWRERSTAGFRALDGGDVAKAERDFDAVLAARPGDADAQGGLGLVRLRQERFDDARRLLQQASRAGSAARWKSALDSASYWSLVRQADTERAARNWPQARRLLEQAMALDANEPTARNALADVLANSGQLAAAEDAYRDILRRQPGNADATRGLIGVLARNNQTEEALRLYEGLDAAQQKLVGPVGALRAQRDIAQAEQARRSGDLGATQRARTRHEPRPQQPLGPAGPGALVCADGRARPGQHAHEGLGRQRAGRARRAVCRGAADGRDGRLARRAGLARTNPRVEPYRRHEPPAAPRLGPCANGAGPDPGPAGACLRRAGLAGAGACLHGPGP
ncbi:MAG: Cellulose synthase operon protein C [Paracidovorax wautersii]|uniref:Cellulose synthase operon protein C n=1 Tax=Paracidovorax wautersii TaxID=1177982 RepID=A0A7V8FP16_9BURK|nr:MAG: Cellulose synthase operon protein C [Paracidovorax wautersii]